MNLRFKTASLLAIIIILFYGCKKDVENLQPVQKKTDKVIEYIKSLGFDTSTIQDLGNMYLVEGDISFPKDMTIPSDTNLKVSKTMLTTTTLQETKLMSTSIIPKYSQAYESLVGRANMVNIRLYISDSAQKFSISIMKAIEMWNDVGSGIKFTVVWNESDPYDTRVNVISSRAFVTCGYASLPVNNRPGLEINLNEAALDQSQISLEQRIRVIAHELGHCIGLRHTNWESLGERGAVEIPDVSGPDPLSIMNGEACGMLGELSIKDKQALLKLYPRYINKEITKKYTQTNCGGIGTPDQTTITVSAGECPSSISQEDADKKASQLWNTKAASWARTATCGGYKPLVSLKINGNLPKDYYLSVDVTYKLPFSYFYVYVFNDDVNLNVMVKGFYPFLSTGLFIYKNPNLKNKKLYVKVKVFTKNNKSVMSDVQEIEVPKY